MRLDVVGGPQPLHARRRDADRARHRPAAPAPEIGRRPHGALQHLLGGPFGQPRLAATSRRIAQPGQPIGRKPPGPTIDLQTRYAQAFGDVLLGQSLGAQEDNFPRRRSRTETVLARARRRNSSASSGCNSMRRRAMIASPNGRQIIIIAPWGLQSYFRNITLGLAVGTQIEGGTMGHVARVVAEAIGIGLIVGLALTWLTTLMLRFAERRTWI